VILLFSLSAWELLQFENLLSVHHDSQHFSFSSLQEAPFGMSGREPISLLDISYNTVSVTTLAAPYHSAYRIESMGPDPM
jgi:hypothetical protein